MSNEIDSRDSVEKKSRSKNVENFSSELKRLKELLKNENIEIDDDGNIAVVYYPFSNYDIIDYSDPAEPVVLSLKGSGTLQTISAASLIRGLEMESPAVRNVLQEKHLAIIEDPYDGFQRASEFSTKSWNNLVDYISRYLDFKLSDLDIR